MDDDLINAIVMDLDLNHEPMESSALGLGSLPNSRIEQRILHLESVAARWRQVHNSAPNSAADNSSPNSVQHHNSLGKGKGCKRDRSHLVAKALEMDVVVKKVDKNGPSFFDCNICFDIAKEPILTCCGHLYCWSCFYNLPYVDSTTKECPECKGEVTDANITPIYGNANSYCSNQVHSAFELPPRPKANRVESVRQQRVTRGLSHIPVAEALRRIRNSIGLGHNPQQLHTGAVSSTSLSGSHELLNTEATGSQRPRSRVFSRVLLEGAASLSSELGNVQRLFEDITTSITDRIHEISNLQVSPIGHDEGNSLRSDAAIIRSEHQTLDSIAEASSVVSLPSSSQSNEVTDATLQMENLSGFSRLSDLDSEILPETRRRFS